jgi:PAS domain S-box-containing protein
MRKSQAPCIPEAGRSLRPPTRFEDLITKISTKFITLAPEDIDRGIHDALKKVGVYAGADWGGVILRRNSHFDTTHEWCARDISPQKDQLQGLDLAEFPYWQERMLRFETVNLPRIQSLPAKAEGERKRMESLGIKSLLSVPMALNTSLVGFLSLASHRRENPWSKEIISHLRVIAEIIVNALERKRAEEVLKESESKYRSLVDNSLTGIYITQDHILKFCNQKFSEIFGYGRPEELIGINVQQLVEPESWELVDRQVRLREKGRKKAARYAFRAVKKDGSVFDVEVLGARIIYEGLPAIQGTIIDNSDIKMVEVSLWESENKYRALFEGVPVGLYRTSRSGKILDLNPTMVQMLGYEIREGVLGKKAGKFYLHPKDRERAAAILAKDHVLRNFEFQLRQADGKVIWVQDNVHAIFDSRGRIACYEGSLLDITKQKQEEEAVQSRANRVIRQQAALLQLDKLDFSDLGGAVRAITEISARTLEVCRVGIWFFDPGHTTIICRDLFHRDRNRHDNGLVLKSCDYPRYFHVLEESCLIAADDARADSRTSEFAATYLKPHGIISMMDVPIRRHGRVIGIICHEHTGERRNWTLEEQQFAMSVSDIVTYAIEAAESKRMEKVNKSIFKISEAANSSRNLSELFRSIHRVISDLMPAKNFYIALYDSVQDVLSFPYFVDEFDPPPEPKKLGKGLTEYVMRTARPLLASPEVFAELETQGEVESIGAPSIDWLGVPLIIDGRAIGVLVVQTYTEGVRYGEEEKNILKFVSDQVAMAVHRKKTEEEVQERERFLSSVFDSIQDGLSILDEDYNIIRVNSTMEKWYAHAVPLPGKKCHQAYQMRNKPCDLCPTRMSLKTAQAAYEIVPKVGTGGEVTGWIELYSFPLIDQKTGQMKGAIEYARDITERKKAEDRLQASLGEKEVLLREIHHRVKNNMQVISSLLSLQSRHVQDPAVLEAFKESQRRIRSMALIHERLYQSSDFSRIEFSHYLRNLATHLFHSYQVNSDRIRLSLDAEEVFLNINTAIPCGLIVNELISNSLKHAFPEGRAGKLGVSLQRVAGDGYVIQVCDDGIGFPAGLDFRQTESLGMQIVSTLANQIEASVELKRDGGTSFTIRFQEVSSKQRI